MVPIIVIQAFYRVEWRVEEPVGDAQEEVLSQLEYFILFLRGRSTALKDHSS